MGVLSVIAANFEVNLGTVESGVPLSTVARFVEKSGLRNADIHEVVLPARTLKHRKARNESLDLDESDKFARLVRVFNQAAQVFGGNERAVHWLGTAKKRFADRTPIQMLRTEIGGRMVEDMLGQIDDGMYA